MPYKTARTSQRTHLSRASKARTQAVAARAQDHDSSFSMGQAVGLLALTALFLLSGFGIAKATEVQKVVSPGGIEAWLVEDHTVPIIAMDFAFTGGTAQDEEKSRGAVNLLTSMLDEGAGDIKSEEFLTALEDDSIKLSFNTSRDFFYGSLRVLTPNSKKGFDLLSLALQKPRFDAEPLERMRSQFIPSAKRAETQPHSILSKTWGKTAYADHPYGEISLGTVYSLKAIKREDLVKLHRNIFTKDGLKIGVVGAIDAKSLAAALDKVFAPLPATGDLKPVADVKFGGKGRVHVPFQSPQTTIRFGLEGIDRQDKDFYPAYMMNHILGGGTFSSRLYNEVREKRGLVYGIYTYLADMQHAQQFAGGMSTRNENVEQAIGLVKSEIARMAKDGPTQQELDDAKKYLTGSYALRFDTSSKIARQLVALQLNNMGSDYFKVRNSNIEAITLEDTKRVAKRLLKPENLLIVTVGPEMKTAKAAE